MANIFWRNGIAWARATVKGVERRESLDTRSAREAEERFQKWVGEIASEGDRWSKGETPFRKAVDKFTTEHLPTLKPASRQRYLVSLINLTPTFEKMSLQSISKADLAGFVSARRKDGVADGTIRRDLACLSSLFTIAEDWELCDANPVLPFMRVQKRRKRLIEAEPRTRYLSHEEEALILEEARRRFDLVRLRKPGRALTKMMILSSIALAIDTGLRDEELLRLPWTDVALDAQQVTVTAERSKTKRQRVVPLLQRAQRIFEGLPRHKTFEGVIWHRNGVGFHDLNHTLQEIAAKVGVTGIRWHDLRRTCGCRLLQDHKMPIEQVSQWLGHSSVTQTQRAYAFLSIDNLHESVGTRRLDQVAIMHRLESATNLVSSVHNSRHTSG